MKPLYELSHWERSSSLSYERPSFFRLLLPYVISDCRLPISNLILRQATIGNWQSEIGNVFTSYRAPSSSQWWRDVGPCACGHSCVYVDHGRAALDDDADHDNNRCPSNV